MSTPSFQPSLSSLNLDPADTNTHPALANQLTELLTTLSVPVSGQRAPFSEVLSLIQRYYRHQPTAFDNGNQHNSAEQNQGSCKVLAFAALHGLTADKTLSLFAEHYQSVLETPQGTDHANIRQFIAQGWAGVRFAASPLKPLSE